MDIEQLNKAPHNQICDLARDKFIEVYNQKFGEGGEVFFEEQKALFNNELLNGSFKGYLEKATSLNIHDAFMNLAINGLSLERELQHSVTLWVIATTTRTPDNQLIRLRLHIQDMVRFFFVKGLVRFFDVTTL